MIIAVALYWLRPEINNVVENKEPKTVDELRHAATLSQRTIQNSTNSVNISNDVLFTNILEIEDNIFKNAENADACIIKGSKAP